MAVVGSAREIGDGRQHAIGDDGTRTYTRVFIVETDRAADDAPIVLTAPGLPRRYDYYVSSASIDTRAKCQEISAEQISGSKTLWRVTCEYTTATRDPEDEEENPLNEPSEESLDFETVQRPIMFYPDQSSGGAYGLTALGLLGNKAGDAFDPAPTYEESRPIITITRNEPALGPSSYSAAALYVNAINSDYWRGLPPRTAKLRSITATKEVKNGFVYARVTYVVAVRQESWDLQLLNAGYRYKTAAGSTLYADFVGANGPYLGLLKADGTKYTSTAFTSTDLIITYRVHKELPFSPLGI